MNHKAILAKTVKFDLRHTVFLMLPCNDGFVPVHFDANHKKLHYQRVTVSAYRDLKFHWQAVMFMATRNLLNGEVEIEDKPLGTMLNGTYLQAGQDAFNELQSWADKVNPKRRVNVGFALTLRDKPITLSDVERWVELDPSFYDHGGVITEKDEKRELGEQIKRLEGL